MSCLRRDRELGLTIPLVIGIGLFLLPFFTSSTTNAHVAPLTSAPTMTTTVFGTDVNGQQHDITTQAVTNIQGFAIREENVIPLERNGEIIVTLQPQQGQINSVTFTTIDGQRTVQCTPPLVPGTHRVNTCVPTPGADPSGFGGFGQPPKPGFLSNDPRQCNDGLMNRITLLGLLCFFPNTDVSGIIGPPGAPPPCMPGQVSTPIFPCRT